MNETERQQWHESENDTFLEKGSEDWKLAEQYKEQHCPYFDKNVLIHEAWRDRYDHLCIQYITSFGRMLDWFHYQVNKGELEWW